MKRFIWLTVIAVLVLGVSACGSDGDSAGSAPEPSATATDLGLKTPGTITVASDIPYAPFEFTKPGSSEVVGFDVDLVKAIAATIGITDVQFVDQSFDGIILAIKQGNFDMSASSWTVTPERAKEVDFGDTYLSANQAILVEKDSTVTGLDDLNGKTIAVQRATVGADLATTVPGAKVLRFESGDDSFNAVAQGRADAAITDFPVVAYAAAQKPTLKVAAEVPGNLGLGLMFPKGSTALRDAFNTGLAAVRADGTYDAIYKEWFGEAPTS